MHDINSMKEKIKENKDKVKVNKTLPYLVANVIELLDVDGEDQEEDGANVDLDAQVRELLAYFYLTVSPTAKRQMCRSENVDPTNLLPACHWPCRARRVEPRRFGRRQQGLVFDPREAAHRV